jgi:hypothetical protein
VAYTEAQTGAFGPLWSPNTGQIHCRDGTPTTFQTVSLGTSVNRGAKGYYEPLHCTVSITFCASGANSSNSVAGLPKPITTVCPSTSSKTIRRNLAPL